MCCINVASNVSARIEETFKIRGVQLEMVLETKEKQKKRLAELKEELRKVPGGTNRTNICKILGALYPKYYYDYFHKDSKGCERSLEPNDEINYGGTEAIPENNPG